MNILIIVSTLEIGGAQRQALIDAELLSKEHQVFLVSFRTGPLVNLINPRVRFISIKKNGYLDTAVALRKLIKKHRIEVVHASLFAPMVISALSTVFSKTTVFWHFHSHEYDIPLRSRLSFRLLIHAPSIRKVLFVNEELMEFFLKRFKFPESKLGILRNGGFTMAGCIRVHSNAKSTIGYIGRLVTIKRPDYLVDLAEDLLANRFPVFKILIVGDGDFRASLHSLICSRNMKKHFEFTGFRPDTEAWFNQFDIFVNPSGEECLSMALIEAGMAGLPAVAFDVGGNSEIILSGRTGFVVKSKQEFFERCRILLENSTLRRQMGKAARQYCREKFGPENHLRELSELYREIPV